MLWTKSKSSIKPELEGSTLETRILTSLLRPNRTRRCDKLCSMATSWRSWDKVTLARTATRLRLEVMPTMRIRPWSVTEMLAAVSQPMPVELETRELELQIQRLLTTRLIFSTLWTRGKLPMQPIVIPSSKWWWRPNFSTLSKIIQTIFPQFPRQLLRPNFANKGKLEEQAILWMTCL